MDVAAVDRIGGALARRAASVGSTSGTRVLDEGIINPFRTDVPGDFQVLMSGNVALPVGRMQGGGRGRRVLGGAIHRIQSNTPPNGILNAIQGVRDQVDKIMNNIKTLVGKKEDLSAADLMEMQYDVMQLAFINEFASKTADKTSQGAQTLFRNQG
jgi:hypothetical protein